MNDLSELTQEAWSRVSDTHQNMFVANGPIEAELFTRAVSALHDALRAQQDVLVALAGRIQDLEADRLPADHKTEDVGQGAEVPKAETETAQADPAAALLTPAVPSAQT